MTIEEMRQRKRELGLTNQMIAERSGIPLSTVQKVFAGATSSPRRETIEALERVLGQDKSAVYGDPVTSDRMVCETSAAYNVSAVDGNSSDTENRLYTLEDYLRLPDDQRVELIDGVFYDMAAPTTIHQSIVLAFFIRSFWISSWQIRVHVSLLYRRWMYSWTATIRQLCSRMYWLCATGRNIRMAGYLEPRIWS